MDIDRRHLCETGSPKSESTMRYSENLGWTWKVALAGISTTLGLAVPIGFTIGVVNSPAEIVKKWCNQSVYDHYNITLGPNGLDSLWSTIVSLFLVGGMIGSLGGASVADRIGRRGTMLASGIALLISALMFIVSKPINSVEIVLLGRFIIGLAGGLVTGVMPMYLSEIAPATLHGAVGVLCSLGLSTGVVVAQVLSFPFILGTADLWNYLFGIYAVLTLCAIFTLPFLPESPKYLYAIRGNKQRAIKELSDIRQLPPELVVWELEAKEEDEVVTEVWSIPKLLSSRPLRINLLLVFALQFGQQTSGINAVFYYSVKIFESAGLSEQNSQYASLGAAVINLVASLFMMPIINKYPRRFLSILSCSLSTAFLIFLSFSITYKDTFSWMLYLCIISLFGYIIVYQIGLGPIPFFIGTELFDVGPRPAAMAIGSVGNWSGNFVVGMTFLHLNRLLGPYVFFLFATSTALLTIFLKTCLPESNARVLAAQRQSTIQKMSA